MSAILALVLVLVTMTIGDIVSTKTKAFVPSVFVAGVIFLLGFWAVFPTDMISIATLGQPVAGVAIYILITHMGTMMNVKELMSQWKTVVISIAGIAGIILFLMTIGVLILGRETAIVGTPPLTGGIVAALLMQQAAKATGNENLAIVAILIYVVQGFVGYPITSVLLKKVGKRLLEGFRKGEKVSVQTTRTSESDAKKLLP
ncbi:hypothetical protein FUT79_07950 [Treponema phagedenis]|uniref:hypothetical protein n=1 Tax=Treponema phagedenis TaxID=162 RepID=UPI0011E66AF7|nr:hypothetical protein [Treponema phagedenis]QEJ95137.1 hypothetical protein FUT79_07950 [Treponema phagedenis]